jgi:hypothetical protein
MLTLRNLFSGKTVNYQLVQYTNTSMYLHFVYHSYKPLVFAACQYANWLHDFNDIIERNASECHITDSCQLVELVFD